MNALTTIVVSMLGSAALFSFIQYLISRHDKKNDHMEEIRNDIKDLQKEMKKSVKDSVRLQLLVLLIMQPNDDKEILELAQHYFQKLKGNWYMSPMFYNWCQKKGISPDWFTYTEHSGLNED